MNCSSEKRGPNEWRAQPHTTIQQDFYQHFACRLTHESTEETTPKSFTNLNNWDDYCFELWHISGGLCRAFNRIVVSFIKICRSHTNYCIYSLFMFQTNYYYLCFTPRVDLKLRMLHEHESHERWASYTRLMLRRLKVTDADRLHAMRSSIVFNCESCFKRERRKRSTALIKNNSWNEWKRL